MLRIIGRRADGVLLVDVGSRQAYAVDVMGRRIARMGDIESPEAMSPEWVPVQKEAANQMRWKVQQVLDRPSRLVEYQYMRGREQKVNALDPDSLAQAAAMGQVNPAATPATGTPGSPQAPGDPTAALVEPTVPPTGQTAAGQVSGPGSPITRPTPAIATPIAPVDPLAPGLPAGPAGVAPAGLPAGSPAPAAGVPGLTPAGSPPPTPGGMAKAPGAVQNPGGMVPHAAPQGPVPGAVPGTGAVPLGVAGNPPMPGVPQAPPTARLPVAPAAPNAPNAFAPGVPQSAPLAKPAVQKAPNANEFEDELDALNGVLKKTPPVAQGQAPAPAATGGAAVHATVAWKPSGPVFNLESSVPGSYGAPDEDRKKKPKLYMLEQTCPHCGAKVEDDATKCESCGYDLNFANPSKYAPSVDDEY